MLEDWPLSDDSAPGRFTTVGAWRGAFGVIERDGHMYGLKVHEFRKVMELPTKVPLDFEIALDIYPGDDRDRESLEEHGWRLARPAERCAAPQHSAATCRAPAPSSRSRRAST